MKTLAELVSGLFGEHRRVCRECKGSGRLVPRPPVKRWFKVLLRGAVILVVGVLALCWLVAKGYLPL